jgi:glycosyltransferase involved in cell wall biosynthesis
LPTVTSDVGGTASLITPRHSGWTVALDTSPDDAANPVASAWWSPEQRASLRREARHWYEQTLRWERSAAVLLALVAGRGLIYGRPEADPLSI